MKAVLPQLSCDDSGWPQTSQNASLAESVALSKVSASLHGTHQPSKAMLRRLASVKKAADAAGRKICFMGMSLTTYLEAAWRDGRAPFDPRELVPPSDIADHNPNEVLVVCTGSQVPCRHPHCASTVFVVLSTYLPWTDTLDDWSMHQACQAEQSKCCCQAGHDAGT